MLKSLSRVGILSFIIFAFLITAQVNSNAQTDTTELWNIIMANGNEYSGEIISKTEKEIVFKTKSIGTITLLLSDVKKLNKVTAKNIKGGEIWLDNPQQGRYFFSPSSYGLRKGEGYYQNVWIFFNQFSYGVTDNFSIGAGTVPLFLFSGSDTPVWITPKFSVPVTENKFAIGGGALIGTVLGYGGKYGIVYGTSTFGNRESNATLGVGYGYIEDEFANRPAITFSGMLRTGKKGYFITENYWISSGNDSLALLSFGGRRIWNDFSLDFGGIIPITGDNDSFVMIPWLGFVISFGN